MFDEHALRIAIASFIDVFPHATLWYNTGELLLIAGRDAAPCWRPERFARALAKPAVHKDLDWSYWGGDAERLSRPEAFCAGFRSKLSFFRCSWRLSACLSTTGSSEY